MNKLPIEEMREKVYQAGLIIFAAGKTLGDWADRAKVNFDAIPPASRREWFVRGLKA